MAAPWLALAHPRRGNILARLRDRPHTPAELSRALGITEATVRHHLLVLRDAGLVDKDQGRPWAYHRLSVLGRDVVDGPGLSRILGAGAVGAAVAAGAFVWRFAALQRPPVELIFSSEPATSADPGPWLLAALLATAAALALAWRALLAYRPRPRPPALRPPRGG